MAEGRRKDAGLPERAVAAVHAACRAVKPARIDQIRRLRAPLAELNRSVPREEGVTFLSVIGVCLGCALATLMVLNGAGVGRY